MRIRDLIVRCFALALSFGVHAQNSNADYIAELDAAGFPSIAPMPFSARKEYPEAITGLYRSKEDKNPRLFAARIVPTKTGTLMAFKAFGECVVSDTNGPLQERIIRVSSQKIEVFYACRSEDSSSRERVQVYLVKSPAGNDFVKKEFAEKAFVFVHLVGLPIPFDTEGFAATLAQLSGNAL